ncbi:MAG: SulP family sulfate transporter [Hyphomicrobiales bacterium]|nr:SulP family sulfate transporter [Hyphomicrobiales bacterium]
MNQRPTFAELFTPKLVTVLREGYTAAHFKADAIAGLTVAIVALPLSMAIAIGSGAKPEQGLYAAVVGGFIISLLGGSRFQIGGPAGAFIALVAATILKFGFDGFMVATLMAGFMLLAIGYLRLGTYIKYIPHPVLVGFTAGIAVIIFCGEIRDLFGLQIEHEPSAVVSRVVALWDVRGTINPYATGITAACLALMLGLKKYAPRFPGMLAAVVGSAVLIYFFQLPVETIGTRFGGIPGSLPSPSLPHADFARILELIPAAIAFALLGGIESLLSAVVADGMTGRRHRSNCELVAQGYANIACALFGGLCATGTIARTATNVRAHAHGPVAGMLHAVFLLAFMMLAAPLASYVPLAALAAVLALVAWNMIEREQFAQILRHDRGEAAVLLATFLLTVFRDLTEGIAVGVTLGAILFMHRMAEMVQVSTHENLLDEDQADAPTDQRTPYLPNGGADIVVYRIAGAFFFGAAGTIAAVLDRIGTAPRAFILDLAAVPLADATAAQTLTAFIAKAKKSGTRVFVSAASPAVRHVLWENGLTTDVVTYAPSIQDARNLVNEPAGAAALVT